MKKTICIVMTAIVALTAASCSAETSNPPTASSEPTEIQYVIYCDSTDGASVLVPDAQAGAGKIQIRMGSEMDFGLTNLTNVNNDQAPLEKTVTLNGVERTLPYSSSCANSLIECNTEALKAYALIDKYSSTDGVVAEYRQGTGELLFYSDLRATAGEGDLSLEEATAIASSMIASLYGDAVAARYTHVRTTDPDGGFIYVYYARCIQGYKTDDTIQIKLDRSGNVKTINASLLGVFEPIADEITAKKIQNAQTALQTAIPDSWTFEDDTKTLVIASDGKCYLEVMSLCESANEDNPETSMEKFYINID